MACPGSPSAYTEADVHTADNEVGVVRLRPGMFVGSTDARGLHHQLFALVASALTEIVAGEGTFVSVRLGADGSATVEDDAPPILADGQPQLELVCTRWLGHAPNPNGRDYTAYLMANALAAQFRAVARSPGAVHTHTFRRGITHAAAQVPGPADARGFAIEFRPDPELFGGATFDPHAIRGRLRELAYLHSGVRMSFAPVVGACEEFCFADGTREHVLALSAGREPLNADPIVIRGEANGVRYEVGLQWCADQTHGVASFANDRLTPHGGTHVTGVRTGVTRAVLDWLRANECVDNVAGDDVRAGLRAVVAARLADAMFAGATRSRLTNSEVEGIVARAVRAGLRAHFDAHPTEAERVVRHARAAAATRQAAKGRR